MPWIYNPLAHDQRVPDINGDQLSFGARKKVYVKPDLMSLYVWNLIRERKLINRAGDPKPPKPARPAPEVTKAKPVEPKKEVVKKDPGSGSKPTSSSHHQVRARVGSESSGTRSAKKKSKAEKKQPDIQKKEVTQGNQDTKIEADAAQTPKKRRKRTFKKKG
jgi:hypothetical protein